MTNKYVRELIRSKKIKYWQVANVAGISENTFSRWLRYELPEDKKNLILEAINNLAKEAV